MFETIRYEYWKYFFSSNQANELLLNQQQTVAILIPAAIYLFKVSNGNIRTIYEVCSKLTRKTPERFHWNYSGIYITNFEQISHIVLVFPILTLNK